MYNSLLKPLLFQFDPEKVHHFTFKALHEMYKMPGLKSSFFEKYQLHAPELETEVFGIKFPNPVGLAAGFDKDAKLFKELSGLGFGFIEIGTVTPQPQDGNPKKRLFRLKEDQAIINRMGFNNEGVEATVQRLKQNKNIIIGGNIGKNKITANEEALSDYAICYDALVGVVDYFVVNVSSPNTPNLRALQDKEPLTKLLLHLQERNAKQAKQKPILLKIAPDLTDAQLLDIIDIVETTKIAGVIATNTTISREGLTSADREEMGGLSGKPLTQRATEVIRFLKDNSQTKFPIIGVGGIMTAADAMDKFKAGASLVQVYTGFIYKGPQLIKDINTAVIKERQQD